MITLNNLELGQTAVIDSFTNDFLALKLIEMGCLPGEKIKLAYIAPLGDPIAIEVSGSLLSLRKQEASTIIVTPISETTNALV
jgi:ferrous iron transport protein A